ncbi:hypothetical protein Pla22_27540 [Rubripirellula amarantea]|uniref:Conserved hypothetical protein CHP03032 domain-containing protein n=1 Tax=Rubripirellula amarantea TaxID=2527999 RepID=A0A5C5WX17_9BACT|nr:TIGR03032 family protein [Rubripirellula amarantea]TWT55100.1 hypothetical protein Pla22_27540 [Rubripirellula amarantea]
MKLETSDDQEAGSKTIEYQCSSEFIPILKHLRASLLVSTYKLGRVAVIQRLADDRLSVEMKKFEQAMGMAVSPRRLAIGTRRSIWHLPAEHGLAIPNPLGQDPKFAYLARQQHITGNISVHDLAWQPQGPSADAGSLWAVNTLFSCLCTFDDKHNFVPRWKPSFVSELAPEDRCHLNGMAMGQSGPAYVTALGQTDIGGGWRENKANGGILIDVGSGESLLCGLSMPHSPRLYQDKLWYLNSGHGQINCVDRISGTSDVVDQVPGYTRGLSFAGQFAFVGMSQIRETNIFGGLPIGEHADKLRCGVAVVDLDSGRSVAWFQFSSDVEEVFAVEVIPGGFPTVIHSPNLEGDDKELWVIPPLPKNSA